MRSGKLIGDRERCMPSIRCENLHSGAAFAMDSVQQKGKGFLEVRFDSWPFAKQFTCPGVWTLGRATARQTPQSRSRQQCGARQATCRLVHAANG